MKRRNRTVTAMGLSAALLWVSCCRPSWSPDGTKILFPYYDPRNSDVGVALYDRESEEVRSLFARRSAKWEDRVVVGQWQRDGESAVLFAGQKELLTLPVDSRKPARRIEVPRGVLCGAGPWPVVDDRLFCCGERVFRIDLTNGTVASRGYAGVDKTVLLGDGQTILYLWFMDREPGFVGYEVGRLDPASLDASRLFRIGMGALEAHGIQELRGSIALEPGGERFAMTARTKSGSVIALLGSDGLEGVLEPALPVETYKLGNIEWALDSERLFATVATRRDDGTTELSLAEISLEGERAKLHPIVHLLEAYAYFEPLEIQIALSPDGETIAVATTYLDEGDVAPGDRALFLQSLDDGRLTKVNWPPS